MKNKNGPITNRIEVTLTYLKYIPLISFYTEIEIKIFDIYVMINGFNKTMSILKAKIFSTYLGISIYI